MPALELARALREQGHQVFWLGTRGGREASWVQRAGFPVHEIELQRLCGTGRWHWLLVPWRLLVACWQARRILKQLAIDVVIGFGGMMTAPGGVAAWLLGKPLLLHEQNAVIGLTNRCLARLACGMITAFPSSVYRQLYLGVPIYDLGCPIRSSVLQVGQQRAEQGYCGHFSLDNSAHSHQTNPLRLLILGGSLGAAALNRLLPQVVRQLQVAKLSIEVWHQCGEQHLEMVRQFYQQQGLTEPLVKVVPFIDDIAASYRWADLVIARAGGMTVAELTASASASILIPYPSAADQHQLANARYYQQQGAAVLQNEQHLQVDHLAALVLELVGDQARLVSMRCAAYQLTNAFATKQIKHLLSYLLTNMNA